MKCFFRRKVSEIVERAKPPDDFDRFVVRTRFHQTEHDLSLVAEGPGSPATNEMPPLHTAGPPPGELAPDSSPANLLIKLAPASIAELEFGAPASPA